MCMRKARSKISYSVFASQYCYATDEMHFLAIERFLTASRLPFPFKWEAGSHLHLDLSGFLLYSTSKFFCMIRWECDQKFTIYNGSGPICCNVLACYDFKYLYVYLLSHVYI